MGRNSRLKAEEKLIRRNHTARCWFAARIETEQEFDCYLKKFDIHFAKSDGVKLFGQPMFVCWLGCDESRIIRISLTALVCLVALAREAEQVSSSFNLGQDNFPDLASAAMQLSWDLRSLAESEASRVVGS